jgi:hypothetical protein
MTKWWGLSDYCRFFNAGCRFPALARSSGGSFGSLKAETTYAAITRFVAIMAATALRKHTLVNKVLFNTRVTQHTHIRHETRVSKRNSLQSMVIFFFFCYKNSLEDSYPLQMFDQILKTLTKQTQIERWSKSCIAQQVKSRSVKVMK